ncbi:pentapeptide repeat-containing protein [Campylobacter sp. RM12647]|uniref:pentapeptide repeat-containing protein n=1 Tax=Campylobacter sp. RM12647 TaxID=2735737 RepID=UPI001D72B952|nr:pentapeptide repeat-containing protein [Campylobacter sp. RM12647]
MSYDFERDIKVKCKNSGTIDFYYATANYKNQKLEEILKNIFVFDGVLHCYIDINEDRVKKITLKGIGKKVRIFDIKTLANRLNTFNEVEFENIFFICQKDFYINNLFELFSPDFKEYKLTTFCNFLFKKCTFTINGKHKINKINFKKIGFQDCRFMEDINFQDCIFSDTPTLENSLIHSHDLIRKSIYFYKCSCYFIPNIKGINNRVNHIFFLNSNFNVIVNFDDNKLLDNKIKISFRGSKFEKGAIFNNNQIRYDDKQSKKPRFFYSEIDFTGAKFYQNINLAGITFFNQVDFSYSEFHGDLNFGYYNFDKNIEKPISFLHCKFYKNIYISCKDNVDVGMSFDFADFFGVARFDKSNFNKCFSVQHSTFHKEVYFIETKFLNDVIFDNTTFLKNVDFYQGVFDSHTSFKSTDFQSFINLNSTKFKNIPILGAALIYPETPINIVYVDIEKNKIDEIDNSLKIDKNKPNNISQIFYLYQDRLSILTNMRETCRIFKDLLLNSNNHISAVSFKKTELYINELEYFYKDNPKLNSFDDKAENISSLKLRDKIDWWFLKLNRTTSDHHTDFLKILLFTLSVIGGYFMINFGLSFDEKTINSICNLVDLGLAMYGVSVVIFLLCLGYEFLFVLKGFSKDKGWLIFIFLAICLLTLRLAYSFNVSEFSVILPMIFIGILAMLFILLANNVKYTFVSFAAAGFIGILCTPNIITPFLGAFSEDARNHYLYKAIDELDSQKALDLSKQILAKEPTSELNAKKTLKDYKDELKSSKLLDESPELKRAIAIDGGVSRLNIAYYLVLAFCIFALQKTMRKNSIIPS